MPKVTFLPSGHTYDVKEGTTILVAAVQNGLQLRHDCTEGICGTDRVKVVAVRRISPKRRRMKS